ncbi:LCP family protein [Streptomyces sp. NPDC052051]|uniref:LCP family protein n=1 Tax=Streptomyces sp. NPDC052051 TaxID=3154649 RepID=UPI003425E5ED
MLVLAAAGIGHAVLTGLDQDIARVDPFKDMKNRPAAGHGMNVLLVGTDGRDGITEEERRAYRLGGTPCNCTDTIMIVHLSADRDRATVVSLPRDSYTRLPEHTDRTTGQHHGPHPIRLNAAYAEGGPNLTVRTIEEMTHLKIDHYLEVDFVSFMKTVDVLGGVRICTPQSMKDAYTGLDLPAGRHLLGGGQALQYVRSRHIDGASDMGRMRRQQTFVAALLDRATSSGVLLNPMKFRDMTQAVLGSVRADLGFETDDMLDLGRAMRHFTPRSSEFATVPIQQVDYEVKGLGSTVKWDEAKAGALFRALRDDKPLAPPRPREQGPAAVPVDVDPRQIRVRVENGTDAKDAGERLSDALAATGFRVVGRPADLPNHAVGHTVIVYDPRWNRSATALATALPGSELRPTPGQGPALKVTVGTDTPTVRPVHPAQPQEQQPVLTGDQVACS